MNIPLEIALRYLSNLAMQNSLVFTNWKCKHDACIDSRVPLEKDSIINGCDDSRFLNYFETNIIVALICESIAQSFTDILKLLIGIPNGNCFRPEIELCAYLALSVYYEKIKCGNMLDEYINRLKVERDTHVKNNIFDSLLDCLNKICAIYVLDIFHEKDTCYDLMIQKDIFIFGSMVNMNK